MTAPLRVLVMGDTAVGNVCDTYRTAMYVPYLAELGVEVRYAIASFVSEAAADLDEVARQVRGGPGHFDRSDIEWADVVVFRRSYVTHFLCLGCGFGSIEPAAARQHGRESGHEVQIGSDWLMRPLFDRIESDPAFLGGRAIVYETDDDLLNIGPSNGMHRILRHELDLLERMVRLADLVTVSTTVLRSRLAPMNPEIRVLRNAVDPEWYGEPGGAQLPGEPRILYYGTVGRVRDYAICREAVDATVRAHPGARRIWLGVSELASHRAQLEGIADEVRPYVIGVPAFARALREARPDIGLAPVVGQAYDQARSELHWLDYSMAGAATVASRVREDGPYRVIRDGVDGLLVRSGAEWRRALGRLAASRDLREEMAGRARERVLDEYHVRRRAAEWADAYRWAADHAGRGRREPNGRRSRPAAARPDSTDPPRSRPSQPSPSPDPGTIFAAYVAAQAFAGLTPLRLHLRCGPARLEGWVNVDTDGNPDLRLDVGYGLPFGDGSVDAIYAWRLVDDLGELTNVLAAEAARVLRAGAAIRLVTGDRARALARRDRLAAQGVILVGDEARMPPFDYQMLEAILRRAGFPVIREVAVDSSLHAHLGGIESRRGRAVPDDVLIVEATR